MTDHEHVTNHEQVKIENPDIFPAYIYVSSPDERARRLRGQAAFEGLAELGLRVEEIRTVPSPDQAAMVEIRIRRPWTFVFLPVAPVDFSPYAEAFHDKPCSIIMDCHFPITRMEYAIAEDSEQLAAMWAAQPVMLANLRLADAVTVPQPDWAADLAGEVPNVYVLPDLELPEAFYRQHEGLTDEDCDAIEEVGTYPGNAFVVRFQEIAMAAQQRKAARLYQAASPLGKEAD